MCSMRSTAGRRESLASENVATETQIVSNFGQPATFVDPRRAMLSVRLNLGR